MTKTLTVFTPTYNRAHLLRRVYASLTEQSCGDFVWMIVDDGSTDDTESVVASFISEGKIEIDYIKKANGGKHTAINCAIERAATELVAFSLDSDDVFTPDAVEKILALYLSCEKKYAGYVFPRGKRNGETLISKFDDTLTVDSWQHAVSSGRYEAETVIVLKSSYAKNFSFPVIEGERFFTEGYVWLQMTEDFAFSRDVICIGDYLEDGYTQNILKVFASSPRAYMMFNDLRLTIWKSFGARFKFAAYYDGFAMACREKGFVGKCSSRALSFFALPFGFAFYILLKIKN
ncbi:MAG: glycosyltransferase family 2 protein [Clostridia bacterium]|nr:glycosyltransferase family 2 protein [Clostridia bacterium]